MPNDAKLGMVVGLGLVVAVGLLFAKKESGAATPGTDAAAAVAPAPVHGAELAGEALVTPAQPLVRNPAEKTDADAPGVTVSTPKTPAELPEIPALPELP